MVFTDEADGGGAGGAEEKVFDAPVKFSIVIPAFKTPERFLREMLDSIAEQTYANWEVCVADGSPAGQSCERVLEQYAKKDSRFKYVILGENKGISGNTNAAMDMRPAIISCWQTMTIS